MIKISISMFFILFGAFSAFAQCPEEPILDKADILAAKKVSLVQAAEVSLSITASSPHTSWKQKGSEATAVTIFVDGKYDQDLLLFAGQGLSGDRSKGFSYEIFLGDLGKGGHNIEV